MAAAGVDGRSPRSFGVVARRFPVGAVLTLVAAAQLLGTGQTGEFLSPGGMRAASLTCDHRGYSALSAQPMTFLLAATPGTPTSKRCTHTSTAPELLARHLCSWQWLWFRLAAQESARVMMMPFIISRRVAGHVPHLEPPRFAAVAAAPTAYNQTTGLSFTYFASAAYCSQSALTDWSCRACKFVRALASVRAVSDVLLALQQ